MDEITYKKLDDGTIEVTTISAPPPPTVETIDLSNFTAEKADLILQMADLQAQCDAQKAPRQDRITEIDTILALVAKL